MPTEEEIARAHERWNRLEHRFGVSQPTNGTFDELVDAYGDPQRHYHTFDHVLDCLRILDRFEHLARRPHEIEAAIWFHDAVYDTKRQDNEELSADWAASTLRDWGASPDAIERVRAMILATCHDGDFSSCDEALALDIDLSILGRDQNEFDRYQEQIRREFDWVPAETFRSGRTKVLTRFLDRDCLFHTRELRTQYEEAAQENLASAVQQLAGTQKSTPIEDETHSDTTESPRPSVGRDRRGTRRRESR